MKNINILYLVLSLAAVFVVFYSVTKYRSENYKHLEFRYEKKKPLVETFNASELSGCLKKKLSSLDAIYNVPNGKVSVLLIYDTRCGHCTEFKKRVWSKLCNLPKNVIIYEIGNETDSGRKIRSQIEEKENIQGYPTVLIAQSGRRPKEYTGSRNADSLKKKFEIKYGGKRKENPILHKVTMIPAERDNFVSSRTLSCLPCSKNKNSNFCDMCKTEFANFSSLQAHQCDDHLWKCPVQGCSAKLLHSSKAQHIQRHRNQRQYHCKFCDSRFNQSGHLSTHMKLKHPDKKLQEKAVPCPICGKIFAVGWNMRTHLSNVHEKERKFKCEVCSKFFAQKIQLQHHVKRHHMEIEHSCNHCDAKYSTKYALEDHINLIHPSIEHLLRIKSHLEDYRCLPDEHSPEMVEKRMFRTLQRIYRDNQTLYHEETQSSFKKKKITPIVELNISESLPRLIYLVLKEIEKKRDDVKRI